MEILKKTMEIFRKTMDFFQKNSHVFRISWEKIEGTREKREKQKERRNIHKGFHGIFTKASTTKTNPRQKQKTSKSGQKQIHGRNKSTATKTKRIPHKIGRKEGQFVPKRKDLRSKILMQTLHFRHKNLVKRIIYCNFVHYKWGFLTTAAIQKLSLL